MSHPTWLWVAFNALVIFLLFLDLVVFHRKAHKITTREALIESAFWIGLALVFNVVLWLWWGPQPGAEYLAGYLIEKSLSVDNLFVFLIIFSYFNVPHEYRHKVLFWGIVGALVFRGIFIFAGVTLIRRFDWMIYVLGAFLVYTGLRLAFRTEQEVHPEKNPVLKLAKKVLPISANYRNGCWTIRENGKRLFTPLVVVLLVIETTDVVFAVDSIPAVLAVTQDPFIVYSSNVFAILGLRALYFALAGVMEKFEYLHYGLAAVLTFVGVKMLISPWYHMPIGLALGFIGLALGLSIVLSLVHRGGGEPRVVHDEHVGGAAPELPEEAEAEGDERREPRAP